MEETIEGMKEGKTRITTNGNSQEMQLNLNKKQPNQERKQLQE
jgi:hypothetical protein